MKLRVPQPVLQIIRPHPAWAGVAAALALTWIGVSAIETADPSIAGRQAQWVPIALVGMFACMFIQPRVIGLASFPLFVASILLLIFLLLPVPRSIVPRVNGATAWIDFHFMRFQPAEMAKITFILAMAWYLRYRDNYRTLIGMSVPFFIMFVPVALILKQPDLGTALLFAPALFVMLVAAGAKLRHLGTLVTVGVLAIAINIALVYAVPTDGHPFLKAHQVNRIKSMVSLVRGEDRYVKDLAYQQDRAMTIIGAGGMTGYGKEKAAVIVQFNRLPEDHNDMIFAVIVNRWGFVGGMVTILLYVVIVLSFIAVSARSKDPFIRLATIGFAGIIFAQAAINIAMTMGLLPITGITLPFVSYGGTSLLMSFMIIGLVANFASRRPTKLARPSFEYDKGELMFQ